MAPRLVSGFARIRKSPRAPRTTLVLSRQTHRHGSELLQTLSGALGYENARQELRWMRESLQLEDNYAPSHLPNGDCPLGIRGARYQPHVDQADNSLSDMVQRRLKGEPLQYILGTQPFGPLSLLVRPPTLIPRPETEEWTLRLASLIRDKILRRSSLTNSDSISVLDLCTGSGCISLLLCHILTPGRICATGVDISSSAIDLARENSIRCGINLRPTTEVKHNQTGRTSASNSFLPLQADILDPTFKSTIIRHGAPFDVITANPPYIPQHEYDDLPVSVRNYEDHRALLGDPCSYDASIPCDLPANYRERGLVFYLAIAESIRGSEQEEHSLLKPGGCIALEVGHDQAMEVQAILREYAGIKNTEVWKDFAGIDRVVLGWA